MSCLALSKTRPVKVIIREALDSDLEDVLRVERAAFEKDEEANLVSELLKDTTAKPLLSLLALEGDQAVGHILFTNAVLEPKTDLSISLLAPMAVLPEFQGRGIGGKLIEHGVKVLAQAKIDLVFVLGYPDFYSRHGFTPAGKYGFEASYPILEKNADAWMVRALRPNVVGQFQGRVVCAQALDKPEYWRE